MIKINLLPPGIFEARVIKRLIVLFSIILVGIVAGCMYYTSTVNKATQQYKDEAAIAKDWKAKADACKSQADSERAKIEPMKVKLDFVKQVAAFNLKYPKLYEDITKYTYHKVTYVQMGIAQGGAVAITAFAPSISDAGRYLLNMYRATQLFSNVSISGVPGYPYDPYSSGMEITSGASPQNAAPPMVAPGGMGAIAKGVKNAQQKLKGFSFTVACQLKDPSIILAPVPPTGSTGGPGGPGGPGAPGMAPGAPMAAAP